VVGDVESGSESGFREWAPNVKGLDSRFDKEAEEAASRRIE